MPPWTTIQSETARRAKNTKLREEAEPTADNQRARPGVQSRSSARRDSYINYEWGARMTYEIPADDPWTAERYIKARLMHHKVIDEVDGVSPEVFVMVAWKIGDFMRRPVTDEDMAAMKKAGGRQADIRAALNRAAAILHGEIEHGRWRSQPNFTEHLRRWEEAIAVLKMPRGTVDNRTDWLDGAKSGPPIRAWSYMATEIGGYTLQALRPYRHQDVSLRHDSGFVAFIREALEFIGVSRPPACSTLSKLLEKNLNKTGALSERTRIRRQNTGAEEHTAKKPG